MFGAEVWNITKGVLQGSVMGSILFIMYIKYLLNNMSVAKNTADADNLAVVNSAEFYLNLIAMIGSALESLYGWSWVH